MNKRGKKMKIHPTALRGWWYATTTPVRPKTRKPAAAPKPPSVS